MTNHTKNCQDPAPKATEPAKPTPNGLSEHYGIEAIRSLAREHYNRAVLAERERDAALAEVSSLENQRDELMADLDASRAETDRLRGEEAAESKGRREAFAEVLRQFETLHCYDTTFLHWLEEAAK